LDDLGGLAKVHIVSGGDHGGGCFWMIFKILLRYLSNKSISKKYEIRNVAHSSDDVEILKDTALKPVIDGLKRIHEGGPFIIEEDEQSQFVLTFQQREESQARILCNLPLHIFINGDLKFFVQILGRNGMGSCWCM
jgi:hypothetical protein